MCEKMTSVVCRSRRPGPIARLARAYATWRGMSMLEPAPPRHKTTVKGTKVGEAYQPQKIYDVAVPGQPELHSDPVGGLRAERILL